MQKPVAQHSRSHVKMHYDADGKTSVVDMYSEDAKIEAQRVENMTAEEMAQQGIIVNSLQKVFPRADGNPPKV